MKSTLGKLSEADFWKGLLVAVGTPVLILLQQLIPSWTEWLAAILHSMSAALIVQAAMSAFVTYILKQLGTDTTKVAIKNIEKAGGIVKDQNNKTVTVQNGNVTAKTVFPIIAVLILLSSCKSLLIPTQDDRQWQAKYNASIETYKMYSDMNVGSKLYMYSELKYQSIFNQISYFTAIDSLRKNAQELFKLDKNLRDVFVKWWNYHRDNNTLTPMEVKSTPNILKGVYDPILVTEGSLSKK